MSNELNPYRSPVETAPAAAPVRRYTTFFKSSRTRASIAMLLLFLSMVTRVVEAGSTFMQYNLLNSIAQGQKITREEAEENDSRQNTIQAFSTLIFLICAIALMAWMYRANANLPALGVKHRTYGPGWTIGGWFIPIGNLFIPYKVMAEIFNGSHPDGVANKSSSKAPGAGLVGAWWACYLIANFAGTATRFGGKNEGIDSLIFACWSSILMDLFMLPAGILAIQIVRQVVANQDSRLAALQAHEAATPLPVRAMYDGPNAATGQSGADDDPFAWLDNKKT